MTQMNSDRRGGKAERGSGKELEAAAGTSDGGFRERSWDGRGSCWQAAAGGRTTVEKRMEAREGSENHRLGSV